LIFSAKVVQEEQTTKFLLLFFLKSYISRAPHLRIHRHQGTQVVHEPFTCVF